MRTARPSDPLARLARALPGLVPSLLPATLLWLLPGCGSSPTERACVDDSACVAPRLCVGGFCQDPGAGDVAVDADGDADATLPDTTKPERDTSQDIEPELDAEFDITPRNCLRFEPSALNFHEVPVGGSLLKSSVLTNCSTLPIVLTDVYVAGDDTGTFVIAQHPELPRSLAAGERTEVIVGASPTRAGEARAELHVAHETGEHFGPLLVNGVADSPCPTVQIGVGAVTSSAVNDSVTVVLGQSVLLFALPFDGALSSVIWGLTNSDGSTTVRGEPSGVTEWLPPAPGTWLAQAGWTADGGCTGSGTALITVTPPTELQVELVWEPESTGTTTDLDLHLARLTPDGLRWSSTDDCYYRQTNPDWGVAGTSGNPVHSSDDTGTPGHETVTLAQPQDDVYVVGVHLYRDAGEPGAAATVNLRVGGTQTTQRAVIPNLRDVWYPAVLRRNAAGGYDVVPIERFSAGFESFTP